MKATKTKSDRSQRVDLPFDATLHGPNSCASRNECTECPPGAKRAPVVSAHWAATDKFPNGWWAALCEVHK
jgi:hypothetical protein